MRYLMVEFSTAIMTPGILCVLMSGMQLGRRQGLFVKLWAIIPIRMVRYN